MRSKNVSTNVSTNGGIEAASGINRQAPEDDDKAIKWIMIARGAKAPIIAGIEYSYL